jgi:hypothetical protein
VNEDKLQDLIMELADLLGWRLRYHTHDSRHSQPGFPDLVLVRERVLFVECKSDRGKPSPAQLAWLAGIEAVSRFCNGRLAAYMWRPADWDSGEIERVLR